MTKTAPKRLRWIRQGYVSAPVAWSPSGGTSFDRRERLIAALADRPRTVAQLAKYFDLSQPAMLEHVRRAVHDGLVIEVEIPEEERRFATERYYAPAVPVIRGPDRELLTSACRAVAGDIAASVTTSMGDIRAAFAMTALAREQWSFDDVWPYMINTINCLVEARLTGVVQPPAIGGHGLA